MAKVTSRSTSKWKAISSQVAPELNKAVSGIGYRLCPLSEHKGSMDGFQLFENLTETGGKSWQE